MYLYLILDINIYVDHYSMSKDKMIINDNIIIYFLYDFIYYRHYLHIISNIISFVCKNYVKITSLGLPLEMYNFQYPYMDIENYTYQLLNLMWLLKIIHF